MLCYARTATLPIECAHRLALGTPRCLRLAAASLIDEAQAIVPAQTIEEREELRVLMIAAQHDDGRDIGKFIEGFSGKPHVLDRGHKGIKEVARVENQIRGEVACNRDDLRCDAFMVGPSRHVVGQLTQMPVGGMQQSHQSRRNASAIAPSSPASAFA